MRLNKINFALGVLVLGTCHVRAATIAIPNFSFESPATVFADPNTASWQEIPKPAYFTDSQFLTWSQTSGVFLDTNPYVNRDGTQAGYMLPFPQVTLFQDLSSPDATFQAGMSYTFTLGVFGKGMAEGDTLNLSLFYRDAALNMVTIGAPTTIVFSTNTFVNAAPLSLLDYSVTVGEVQAGDAWAGKNIGVKMEAGLGNGNGNWDIDNARLVAIPEPGSLALLALGFGAWLVARRRFRR